eukprot:2315454-Rhodomonas_salina.1
MEATGHDKESVLRLHRCAQCDEMRVRVRVHRGDWREGEREREREREREEGREGRFEEWRRCARQRLHRRTPGNGKGRATAKHLRPRVCASEHPAVHLRLRPDSMCTRKKDVQSSCG